MHWLIILNNMCTKWKFLSRAHTQTQTHQCFKCLSSRSLKEIQINIFYHKMMIK